MKKNIIKLLILVILISVCPFALAEDKGYPDVAYLFLGVDKWETYNRKMFNFNQRLNKYFVRPIHIVWSSIMPQYGIDRIRGVSNNIEYPIRLVSSLVQRDFQVSKNETKRFLINTTIGLAGMFDPARHILKVEQAREDMDQALEKCKVKSGPFFVVPVLYFTTFRGLAGKLFDMALNPSFYIGTPVLAAVKACLVINRTAHFQPLLKMVESNYADPYEIQKKAFGIDSYIKRMNLDRIDYTGALNKYSGDEKIKKVSLDVQKSVSAEILAMDNIHSGTVYNVILEPDTGFENISLEPDIVLKDYNPQSPIVDSMRTALFSLPDINKSIWNELSVWNRSYMKRVKTASVKISEGKDKYNYKYILHKGKQTPLVILYPSIGEGVNSSHSILFSKLFYDEGYSVLIMGNPFQWEFVKSMPDGYYPGIPSKDAEMLLTVTSKIISDLETKHNKVFPKKVIMGTSYGALTSLFIGAKESKNNTLGETEYICICPPIDLMYAMKQVDKVTFESIKSEQDVKKMIGVVSSKIVQLYQLKNDKFTINKFPFSEEEGKLITGFIMHQKLSDLIFTIKNAPKNKKSDIYSIVNNMCYYDYAKEYLMSDEDNNSSYDLSIGTISDFLENNNNYKIYHSVNDYLTSKSQLKQLKMFASDRMILIDNGSHLGFLYREEFINDLKKTIRNAKNQVI